MLNRITSHPLQLPCSMWSMARAGAQLPHRAVRASVVAEVAGAKGRAPAALAGMDRMPWAVRPRARQAAMAGPAWEGPPVAVAVPQILRRPVETVGAVARGTPLAPAAAARPPMELWEVKAGVVAGRPMQPQGEALGVASRPPVDEGAPMWMRATEGTSMAPHNWSQSRAAPEAQVARPTWTSPLRTAAAAEGAPAGPSRSTRPARGPS